MQRTGLRDKTHDPKSLETTSCLLEILFNHYLSSHHSFWIFLLSFGKFFVNKNTMVMTFEIDGLFFFFCSVQGVTGEILVNGKKRVPHSERWRRTSCYIQQDSLQRTRLTVGEAMTLAAHLKLGYTISSAYKHTQVCKLNRFCSYFLHFFFFLLLVITKTKIQTSSFRQIASLFVFYY